MAEHTPGGADAGDRFVRGAGSVAAMTDLHARMARPTDLTRIEELVTGMFRDLGTTVIPGTWSSELRHALTSRLGRDVGACVTADQTDQPIAVAVGIVDCRLPSPRRLTGRIGYVEWLATDERHRRRGAARMALNGLLLWFDSLGVNTVDVHASNAAHRLYTDAGFVTPAASPLRRSTGDT